MRKKILLSLLIVAFCAGSAFAADGKIYPGSMGAKWSSNEPDPVLSFGAIGNPSATKWLRLDLPVIHDSINHSIKDGWVKAIDMHYSGNISARLYSVYRNGCSWYGWLSPSQATSGVNCAAQTLSFGALGSNSSAHYYYSCSIPPTYSGQVSYIVSYKVNEKE
jgi:hypothetical protein